MITEDQVTALSETIKDSVSVPYIKLLKNTKGYNWEIKSLGNNVDEIEALNNKMLEKFGGVEV